jgi:1,4-dihydroxy-2-naphthoyl-CoA hydrolase
MTEQENLPSAGELADKLGMRIVSATAQEVVGTMPVAGNTQPFGLLNGGASLALAETLGSIGAYLHAGEGRVALGIEVSGSHHKAAREGIVRGTATAVTLGNTLAVYDVAVVDGDGVRICSARVTCLIREQKKLN